MVRVFVVYDTKYGNTKLVAEKIVEGLREVEGIETAISDVDEVDVGMVAGFDAILIGSPNHGGGPARSIKKFVDELGKLDLKPRWVAVFDTYVGGGFGKAVGEMEKRLGEKVAGVERIASGLSVEVEGLKGPIVEGELPKCRGFGRMIAGKLK